jgi:OPA family glycerol-3-phosphate transporter-like MFS transporter/OPA family sugar phosphate sensor protein UhpC-like MFS transporter
MAPAATTSAPSADVARTYARWQNQVLYTSLVGYAMFYFVRKNLPAAMPGMSKDLGIGLPQLGLFLTLHGVLYGVSKFVNGFVGDRVNARYFMALGLLLSALVNVAFGFGTTAFVLGTLWLFNGWFQGMGFPPCARLLTHWFPPRQIPIKMSIWNTSHSLGAAGIVILCGYLASTGNWRLCFWVPAGLALLTTLFLLLFLRDTPESLGLPPVEEMDNDPSTTPADREHVTEATTTPDPSPVTLPETDAAAEPASYKDDLMKYVFTNKYIWLVSIANFFVYVVRYGMLDWGPTFLKQAKGIELSSAGWMVAAFELSGATGALFAGWITHRYFAGKGARACVIFMILCSIALVGIWKLPPNNRLLGTVVLCAAGFLVYGPQCLIGIVAANLATKRAAASAVGLTGIFGYASTVLSGWGVGLLAQNYGWNAVFVSMIGMAVLGTLLFAAAWPAKAHG